MNSVGNKNNRKLRGIGNKVSSIVKNIGQKVNPQNQGISVAQHQPSEIHENISNGVHVETIPKGLGNQKYPASQQSDIEKRYSKKF